MYPIHGRRPRSSAPFPERGLPARSCFAGARSCFAGERAGRMPALRVRSPQRRQHLADRSCPPRQLRRAAGSGPAPKSTTGCKIQGGETGSGAQVRPPVPPAQRTAGAGRPLRRRGGAARAPAWRRGPRRAASAQGHRHAGETQQHQPPWGQLADGGKVGFAEGDVQQGRRNDGREQDQKGFHDGSLDRPPTSWRAIAMNSGAVGGDSHVWKGAAIKVVHG
jgi:hypothetical protein